MVRPALLHRVARSPAFIWLVGVPAAFAAGIGSLLAVIPIESLATIPAMPALFLLVLSGFIGWLNTVSFPQSRMSGCVFAGCSLILVPGILLALVFFGMALEPRFWAFGQLYRHLKPGMTRGEIDALIARDYPAGGPRQRPRINVDTTETVYLFMHAEITPSGHSAEGIFLFFENGRLARKQHSPD